MGSAERDTARIDDDEPSSGSNVRPLGSLVGDRYVIDAELGRGAMGVVYAARHRDLGTPCAVKVMFEQNPTGVARLLREAKIAASLDCRHIVKVRDFGTSDGQAFVVMDRLDGTSLDRVIEERAPLPEAQVIEWGKQICAALAAAHSRGVVHRDLKPANVFVERDGQLRVLDFGVAKLQVDASSDHVRITHEGTLVGSPSYMAPEQIRDAREVDLRADLWSLGVTLYECLTGICPFRGAHVAGTLAAISADAPSPLPRTVSRPLAAIIDRCLQKDPNARFASADALLRALEAQPDARVAAPAKRLVAAAVGFAIVGFAGLALWAGKGERMSATPAQRTSAASDIRTEPLHVATRAAPTPVGAPSPSPAVTVTGQAHHPRGAQPATASTTTAEPPHSAATMPSTPRDIRSAIGERH